MMKRRHAGMPSTIRDSQQPYAVVVGLEDARGVYAARTLARHNVPIIAISRNQKSVGSRTNVCERILIADTANEEFIETLETLGPKFSQKAVLLPCLDMSVLLISRHRDKLEQWYHVVLPSSDVVEMMLDKAAFYTYAQKEGFPIPRTFLLESAEDVEKAMKELTFPCALKPSSSKTPMWLQHTHVKAFKIANSQELLSEYQRHRNWADTLIAQEWIEGRDDSLYTSFCYFNTATELLVAFTSRKCRQWPPYTGDACLAEECSDDVVLQETLRLFRSVNFRGLGYVEFKRDERSGKYLIVEPNIGRTAAWMGIAEAGNVELLFTLYCDSAGLPLPTNHEQKYEGVKWIYFRKDVQSALHYWVRGELTLRALWRSWRGRKVDALFSWHDPGPFLGDLQQVIRLYFSDKERRKRGYGSLGKRAAITGEPSINDEGASSD